MSALDTQSLMAAPVAQPKSAHWTATSRFGFRFALLYGFCFLFAFGNGSLLMLLFFAAGTFVKT
jgi:hypothetical protein